MNESKVFSGIMGLVVGDALGVPYEFQKRGSFTAKGMRGWGIHNQPPGTWSDDSSMTLATLDSLGSCGCIDVRDIMSRFHDWLYKREYTPYGEVFDVGCTTSAAIGRYHRGVEPDKTGGQGITDNGNGGLMRILPLAFVEPTINDIYTVCGLTHAHWISKMACAIYVTIAEVLLIGAEKQDALNTGLTLLKDDHLEFSRLYNLPAIPRKDIRSNGYVIHTLEAALWSFLTTESYKECVLTAVNLGDDTDTTAAVAGGLAGIFYGCGGKTGIPRTWIKRIPRLAWITELCDNLKS